MRSHKSFSLLESKREFYCNALLHCLCWGALSNCVDMGEKTTLCGSRKRKGGVHLVERGTKKKAVWQWQNEKKGKKIDQIKVV